MTHRRLFPPTALALFLLASSADPTPAQPPPKMPPTPLVPVPPQAPTVAVLAPLGGQRGGKVELTLTGTNLAGPVALWTDFPVKATFPTDANNGKDNGKLRVVLDLPADAPVGAHSLRLVTGDGASNVRVFCVDELPQAAAAVRTKAAQSVPVPFAVEGRIAAETGDYFKFAVKAGQRVCFEVLARRLGSPLDAVLRLHDARTGRELPGVYAADEPGLQGDARLTHTFKEAGEYLVEVRDATHRGGDFFYRLRVGDFPSATLALPAAIRRGTKTTVRFAGPQVEGVAPVEVTAPADPGVPAIAVVPRGPSGLAGWPVTVWLSDHDELVEREPNDEPAQANRLPVPGGATGLLQPKGDRDHYVFAAKKGQRYVIAAQTAELHSPAEVVLTLLNPAGGELARTPPAGPPRLDFTAAADGDVVLRVEHVDFAGGPIQGYRVTVGPAAPGLELTLGVDRVGVAAGGTTVLPIQTLTRRGVTGPVEVSVVGAAGLSGTATIAEGPPPPPGGALGLLPVTAAPGLAPGAYAVRVRARAVVAGQEVVAFADLGGLNKQVLGGLPFPPREWAHTAAVAVTAPPPFQLAVRFAPEALRGKPVTAVVTATRAAGFADEVVLQPVGLPLGVAVPAAKLAKGQNEVQVTLNLPPTVPLGPYAVTVVGRAKYQGRDFAVLSAPATLAVGSAVPVPFELRVEPTAVKMAPNGKAKLKVTAIRKAGYDGPIVLKVANLPAGVTAAAVNIAKGQTTAEVVLVAAKAKVGTATAQVQGTGATPAEANASPGFTVTVGK